MSPPATTPNEMHAQEAEAAGARVERLLGEVRAGAGPMVWPRVEELLRAMMELYARGLGRLFDHLAEVGALDEKLRRALAGDELVASLLSLHGLHPSSVQARIADALGELAAQLGPIELVAIDAGVARLVARDAPGIEGAATLVERVVLEAAPEVERVEIVGLRAPATVGPLVKIDLERSRARRE